MTPPANASRWEDYATSPLARSALECGAERRTPRRFAQEGFRRVRCILPVVIEGNTTASNARLRGGYFTVQGAGIVVWWAVMFYRPATMSWFFPKGMATEALTAFLPADALFAAGSFVTAWLASRAHPRERLAAWFVAGAAVYATLWCLGIWLLTGEALAGVLCMLPCALASVACAVWAGRS